MYHWGILIWQLSFSYWLFIEDTEFFYFFNRCSGAGHIREDILYYNGEFEKFTDDDDEERAYLMDMGIKALR